MDIKKKIKERGFTISQVAALMPNRNGELGITQPSLSQMLGGNPTLDNLKSIASIIGISVSELLQDDDAPNAGAYRCPHCGRSISIKVE